GEDGRFRGSMPGNERAEIRGQVKGPTITVERWEPAAHGQVRQTAQWQTVLPPPYPIVRSGVPVVQPFEQEKVQRGGVLERLVVGRVISLVDRPMEIYFATGEMVTLPARGSVAATARELESPHVVELRRSGIIDIIVT